MAKKKKIGIGAVLAAGFILLALKKAQASPSPFSIFRIMFIRQTGTIAQLEVSATKFDGTVKNLFVGSSIGDRYPSGSWTTIYDGFAEAEYVTITSYWATDGGNALFLSFHIGDTDKDVYYQIPTKSQVVRQKIMLSEFQD